MKMQKISFVIPCYNSEKYVSNTVEKLEQVIEKQLKEYETEVILVNDGSKDNTFRTIEQIASKNNHVTAIDFTRNFGQHSAIMAGLNQSNGDIIICLDDDGQTPPEEVTKLIDALDENTDVVYAKYEEKKHNTFRNFGSIVNSMMAQVLLNKPKDLYISSFFAMRSYIKDEIITYRNPYPYMEGLVLRATNKIKNVTVNHKEREVGKSQYTIKKLFSLWVNGFTNFSVKPLRIAIFFSVLFIVIGIIATIALVINKIMNPAVPMGWTSMIILLLIIGAVITFILGLIGEYVGRIYISINNNPQYVIRKVVKNEKES
ncbi:MAG: glycosyltransferase [Clostridia bacterium]|nr:glycosyltransferase [Clostridia bacterium]